MHARTSVGAWVQTPLRTPAPHVREALQKPAAESRWSSLR